MKKEIHVYQFNAAIAYRFNPLHSAAMTRESKKLDHSHLLLTSRSFTCSAALIRSLARSLTRSRAHEKKIYVNQFNAAISYHFNQLCSAAMTRESEKLDHSHLLLTYCSFTCSAALIHWPARSLTRPRAHEKEILSISYRFNPLCGAAMTRDSDRLARSLPHLARLSLIHLFRTAHLARALRCAHSFARISHSLLRSDVWPLNLLTLR